MLSVHLLQEAGVLVMSDLNIETRPCTESRVFPLSLYRRGGMVMASPGNQYK